jgi:hypothetical protein
MGDILMYYYLLDKHKKEVLEFNYDEKTFTMLRSMGIKCYEHFPYEEAGFEDPYAFMDEYKVIKLADNILIDCNEVSKGIK